MFLLAKQLNYHVVIWITNSPHFFDIIRSQFPMFHMVYPSPPADRLGILLRKLYVANFLFLFFKLNQFLCGG